MDAPRAISEIQADLDALEASGTKNPAKLGSLRKEKMAAMEARIADLEAGGVSAGSATAPVSSETLSPSDRRREEFGYRVGIHYIEKFGANPRHLDSYTQHFDAIFDGIDTMLSKDGREALAVTAINAKRDARDLRDERDELRSKLAVANERIRALATEEVGA